MYNAKARHSAARRAYLAHSTAQCSKYNTVFSGSCERKGTRMFFFSFFFLSLFFLFRVLREVLRKVSGGRPSKGRVVVPFMGRRPRDLLSTGGLALYGTHAWGREGDFLRERFLRTVQDGQDG
ncbi:hypothetical protein LZ32DRAFT_27129 [Colletotrichum eremochloae]|nr:hypothetical protein LZ32DRAFT_27129 [Colletotrichum eremochloae]